MLKTIRNISLAIPSLILATTTLVAVPVFADHGGDGTSGGDTTSQTQTTSGSGGVATSTTTESSHDGSGSAGSRDSSTSTTENEATTEAPETESDARQKGAELVDQLKSEQKSGKSDQQRTQTCEAHKQGLETKFASISKNAAAFQTRIDVILTKAETYQQANNVTVANWDSLVAAATTAQQNSAASIATLKTVTPSLDCNNTSVATDIATFKVAAQNVRDNLKAYKSAVKAVLQALEAAKQATTTTTTQGGNQ